MADTYEYTGIETPKDTIYKLPGGHKVRIGRDVPVAQRNELIAKKLSEIQQMTVTPAQVAPAPMGILTDPLRAAGRVVTEGALPVAGGLAGGALGSALAPGPGTAVGGALGAMAGEGVNQALGITPPSPLMIGAAGIPIPGMAMARGAAANLPGAQAGLHELARRAGAETVEGIAPRVGSKALYGAAMRSGAEFDKGPVLALYTKLGEKMAALPPSQRGTQLRKSLNDIGWAISQPGEQVAGPAAGMPIAVMQKTLQSVGEQYRYAMRNELPSRKELGEVNSVLHDLVDTLAQQQGGRGGQLLLKANAAFKRELAQAELLDIQQKALTHTAGHPAINWDSVLTKLDPGSDTYKQLVKWAPEAEIKQIRAAILDLSKIAPIGSGSKTGVGGASMPERALVSGVLGFGVSGGNPLGAAGGVLAVEGLNRMLMSPMGRRLIKSMAGEKMGGHGPRYDQLMNIAAQGARAGLWEREDTADVPAISRGPR